MNHSRSRSPFRSGILHSEFELFQTLGTGSFGRVVLAKTRSTHKFFALKILPKTVLIEKNQVEHVVSEKTILESLDHPFIVRLHASYQDQRCLYMVMDFVVGGELHSHLIRAGRFPNDVAKFYAAEIVLALEYLHSKGIIYRDLKPENVLLDQEGHVCLVDFGFAKVVSDRTYTACGTPEYLAPEIIMGRGHGKAVDWWCLGILIYEMIVGHPPFCKFDSESVLDLCKKIVTDPVQCPRSLRRHSVSDLIRRLLHKNPSRRLGSLLGGAHDIKNHRWFRGVPWDSLYQKRIQSPIPIRTEHEGDSQHFFESGEPGMEEFKSIPDASQPLFREFAWGVPETEESTSPALTEVEPPELEEPPEVPLQKKERRMSEPIRIRRRRSRNL